MHIDTMVFEVTRRCNIKCDHCLRGNAQNKNLRLEYISKFFSMKDLQYINTITMSGGEPGLASDVIIQIAKEIHTSKVIVDNFYIATNGTCVTPDFIKAIRRLYKEMNSPDSNMIHVSMDIYHQREDLDRAIQGLQTLRNKFSRYFSVEDRDKGESIGVVSQGRAKENNLTNLPVKYDKAKVLNTIESIEGSLYLNCNGWIVDGCDWSYSNQYSHRLCHVNDIDNLVDSIYSKRSK